MPNMKNYKKIPEFKSEQEERDFWSSHDSTDYINWDEANLNPVMPKLKPSTRPVSIRLPEWLIAELKRLANWQDIPYQSLVKQWLAEKVKKSRGRS